MGPDHVVVSVIAVGDQREANGTPGLLGNLPDDLLHRDLDGINFRGHGAGVVTHNHQVNVNCALEGAGRHIENEALG